MPSLLFSVQFISASGTDDSFWNVATNALNSASGSWGYRAEPLFSQKQRVHRLHPLGNIRLGQTQSKPCSTNREVECRAVYVVRKVIAPPSVRACGMYSRTGFTPVVVAAADILTMTMMMSG